MIFSLGYYVFLYPVLARALREIYTRPQVDTGGEVWQQAVLFQTYALMLAQLLLAGVMVTKAHYPCALATLFILVGTVGIFRSMRLRMVGQAQRLPLQRCIALDRERKADPGGRQALNLTPFLYDHPEAPS